MKDIKSYIIGFLSATCLFLFMGQTVMEESEVGNYQVSTTYRTEGNWVFETIIDTETGNIISRERKNAFKNYPK